MEHKQEQDAIKARAITCGVELGVLHMAGHKNDIAMAHLIVEAKDNKYHTALGVRNFEDYIAKYANIPAMPRQAAYLENIVRKADALKISDETLAEVGITNLKNIFTLDPTEHGKDIKALLKKAKTTPFEKIKEMVAAVKKGDSVPEDGEATTGGAPANTTTKVTFNLCDADTKLLKEALAATNQKDPNVALVALANVYLAYSKATVKELAKAA